MIFSKIINTVILNYFRKANGTSGGIGIKKLNIILILLVLALLTVSTASSKPEGLIVKEGVLTYPVGSYHEKNPTFLYINTCGDYNQPQSPVPMLKEVSENTELEKQDKFPGDCGDQDSLYTLCSKQGIECILLKLEIFLFGNGAFLINLIIPK